MMEEYVKAMLGKIDTSLIAKITKVHGNGFVDVEPMAEFQDVKLPPILHVPMCQLGNKKFNLKVKFKAGDVVPILILAETLVDIFQKKAQQQIQINGIILQMLLHCLFIFQLM